MMKSYSTIALIYIGIVINSIFLVLEDMITLISIDNILYHYLNISADIPYDFTL